MGVAQRRLEHERRLLEWTKTEVSSWVRLVEAGGFAEFAPEFETQNVGGALLATLTQSELVSLGLRDLATRRRFWEAIQNLRVRAGVAPLEPPSELVCPITQELVREPVAIAGDEQGHAYEREAISQWFE